MSFDKDLAGKLWAEVYSRGYDGWDCEDEVVRIAAMCGLGVFSVEGMKYAATCIRSDYRTGRNYSRERFAQLASSDFAERWAECLSMAAKRHPTPIGYYPRTTHEVPCWGSARTGMWSYACYRAAWGNIEPYGLEQANKPCPRCGQPMHYWCWSRKAAAGSPDCQWSIDHHQSHASGGCVCPFNLKAMHPSCNSSKGKG